MRNIKLDVKKDFNERRKSQRLNISILIKYRILPKSKILDEIFCQDISGGGLKLCSGTFFKKGERLKTLIHFPDDKKPVSAISKVVWCKKRLSKDKLNYDIGVRHLKIISKDKMRFVFLFCEMMLNYFVLGKGKS